MRPDPESISRQNRKRVVVTLIALPVALLHFVTGPSYRGPFPDFVNGYLIDILLPFALYFILCPQDTRLAWILPWYVKALPVMLVGVIIETSQYLGLPVFGSTFDPLDYAAYALGIACAALVDKLAFPRIFEFW